MVAILKQPYPQLRRMRLEDIEQVIAIEMASYEYPWTYGIFRDCLGAGYQCSVLTQALEIVGYGILSVAAAEAHILNVCVAPEHRGRGKGRRIVKRMIELARWQRATRVFLEVRPTNLNAVKLYYGLGFNEIGTRLNYYPSRRGREDATVMALELLPPERWECSD